MANEEKQVELFEKVLHDLKDFLPYLVLVGGWVPFLYSQCVWKIRYKPVVTADIDFGFQDIPYKGKTTIASKIKQQNYGEHHVDMGRMVPFVPIARLGKGNIKADVEFITSPETSDEVKEKLVGREIKINTIEDFEILLQSPALIKVKGLSVQVPNTAIFTLHKFLTFAARGKAEKRLKDLYYAYFMLFFSPEKEKLTSDISHLMKNIKQGNRARDNIEKHFEDPNDRGPAWIEEITEGSPIQTLVDDVRQDSFDRVIRLVHVKILPTQINGVDRRGRI